MAKGEGQVWLEKTLERHEKKIDTMTGSINTLRTDLAVHKAKTGVVSAIISACVAVAGIFFKF